MIAALKSFVSKVIAFTHRSVRDKQRRDEALLADELAARAVRSGADFVEPLLDHVLIFDRVDSLWKFALSKVSTPEDGQYIGLEFGVFRGRSIRFFSSRTRSWRWHGFDSFRGLADDWPGTRSAVGTFDRRGALPFVPDNVELHQGWFEDTVPAAVIDLNLNNCWLVHIDSDTYPAARLVLGNLLPRLPDGCVIVFDDFHSYPNWQRGESSAFAEVCVELGRDFVFLAFSKSQAVVRMQSASGDLHWLREFLFGSFPD